MGSAHLFGTILLMGGAVLAGLLHGAGPDSAGGAAADPVAAVRARLEQVEALRRQVTYQQGLEMAQEALGMAEALGHDELVTEALYQISLIHYFLESFEEARAYMDIGLTHARLHKLEALEADLLNAQGVLEWKLGNLFEATAKLESALEIRERGQQWVSMASIANNLGLIAYSQHRYAQAVGFYRQGLEWLGEHDNDRMRASLYSNVAESLIPLGQYEEAEHHLLQSLELEKRAAEPYNLAYTYYNLAELRSAQGDSEAAVMLFHTALDMQLATGNEWGAALTRLKLGREFMVMGDAASALAELEPGFTAVKRLNAITLLRDYAGQFAEIHDANGDAELSRYYTELREWFAGRAEQAGGKGATEPVFRPLQRMPMAAPPLEQNLSLVRMGILSLLVVLVAFLLVENIRLRRQATQQPGKPSR
jgi:tetratricopeptide (TPR) repeat protein